MFRYRLQYSKKPLRGFHSLTF